MLKALSTSSQTTTAQGIELRLKAEALKASDLRQRRLRHRIELRLKAEALKASDFDRCFLSYQNIMQPIHVLDLSHVRILQSACIEASPPPSTHKGTEKRKMSRGVLHFLYVTFLYVTRDILTFLYVTRDISLWFQDSLP